MVIEKVRIFPSLAAPLLDETVKAAHVFLESKLNSERPYVQGNEMAKWLRRFLKLSADRKIDPFSVLKDLGIDFRAIKFGIPSLDGIAVWGKRHGPGVVLNEGSNRLIGANIWQNGAARITAAHELCHLLLDALLDAEHPLSAIDILGGRMPLRIEQRARAFAAEFLLPSKVAAAAWERQGSPLELDGAKKVIKSLQRTHGVTSSVAAWQLEHGITSLDREILAQILDQVAPQR